MVGIIPGSKEPKGSVNSFLRPLVEELKEFWDGVILNRKFHPLKKVCVRAAVTCCTCDIPATRKLCGFVGHCATRGCSKCSKEFKYDKDSNKMNFSGYNKEEWPIRDLSVHHQQCENHLLSQTKSQRQSIEKEYGIRYSALVDLPYFNPIRYAVVDPMHNLFLGTAKHVMQVWMDKNIITKSHCEVIEQTVAKIQTPRDVGRLPLKIASSFAGFTADQWRNWVTIFSAVSLKTVLPNNHLRCWLLFVRACSLLCTRVITVEHIDEADGYLVEFCKQYLSLYGFESCTPNMHLHLHLKECLKDYGTVHSFWCFSFERFNGILGKYHTNNKMTEAQIMQKFLSEQQIKSVTVPTEADDMFQLTEKMCGSLHESSSSEDILQLKSRAQYEKLHSNYSIDHDSKIIYLLPPLFSGVLTLNEICKFRAVYKFMYPNVNIIHFSPFYVSAKKCDMAGELFTSCNTRERSSVITAYWPVESLTDPLEKSFQVGTIIQFLKHKIKVNTHDKTEELMHIFCRIKWSIKHNQQKWYGSSALLCTNITYGESACSFIPIQRIAHHCAYGHLDVVIPPHRTSQKVFVAIPIQLKY